MPIHAPKTRLSPLGNDMKETCHLKSARYNTVEFEFLFLEYIIA